MTPINNLIARISYNVGSNLPVVMLMHGWSEDAHTFSDAMYTRLANYGLFVCGVGMRGRNSADGARDASAREIYDIYDALAYVRTNYPTIVSSTIAAIVGYSGGGGNTLAACCKFPDAWNVAVDHFGMADYGRNNPNAWYYTNTDYDATIITSVGDTPANVPDKYYARDATVGITNYSGGYLYMYHSPTDDKVSVVNSQRIKAALDAVPLTNYAYSESTAYTHGTPDTNPTLATLEPTWIAKIKSQAAWTIPASGTITVIGYIITKRFTIWLNTGLDAAATVVYDTVAGTYTVTPLTSNAVVAVTITQGALTASGNTNGATLFTVA